MDQPAKKYFTPEEYLALEEAAEYKSEYYRGEIFNVAGATVRHSQIITNVMVGMGTAVKNKNCRMFSSDLRLWIQSEQLFTYPDIMIVCDKPEFYPGRIDTMKNPLLIFEILSESTENYDRGKKFQFYRSIPVFKEYVLIDQAGVHIEQFNIGPAGKWQLTEYNDVKEQLKLTAIDLQIPLEDIYYQVEFAEKRK